MKEQLMNFVHCRTNLQPSFSVCLLEKMHFWRREREKKWQKPEFATRTLALFYGCLVFLLAASSVHVPCITIRFLFECKHNRIHAHSQTNDRFGSWSFSVEYQFNSRIGFRMTPIVRVRPFMHVVVTVPLAVECTYGSRCDTWSPHGNEFDCIVF